MRRDSVSARAWLGALGCAGIAGAHWLAYLLADAGHHHDEGFLASTGHAYWPYFAALAMAALVAGLARPLIRGFRTERPVETLSFVPMALVLTVIQAGGFLALEVGERVLFAPGHSLDVFGETVVLWGLALQVVTALAATIAVRVLTRVAAFVARLRRTHAGHRAASATWVITRIYPPALVPASGGASLRAPPAVR
jgi:hypothetical protein